MIEGELELVGWKTRLHEKRWKKYIRTLDGMSDGLGLPVDLNQLDTCKDRVSHEHPFNTG